MSTFTHHNTCINVIDMIRFKHLQEEFLRLTGKELPESNISEASDNFDERKPALNPKVNGSGIAVSDILPPFPPHLLSRSTGTVEYYESSFELVLRNAPLRLWQDKSISGRYFMIPRVIDYTGHLASDILNC
jgi:hypothetical protein